MGVYSAVSNGVDFALSLMASDGGAILANRRDVQCPTAGPPKQKEEVPGGGSPPGVALFNT